jgi:hypothetical protein
MTEVLTICIFQNHLEPIGLSSFLSRTETRLVDTAAHDLEYVGIEAMGEIAPSGGTHRRLRWVGDGIVDLITTVSHVSKNGIRLLDQIDLETNVIYNVGTFPRNGDDSDQIDEWNPTSAVVDERGLTFFASVEHSLQMCNSDVVGILSLGSLDNFSVGC